MREPLHHYMKVGIIHFMAYPACMKGEGPVLESLQTFIEDEFFQLVEMAPITDPAVRKEAMARAKAAKLTVGMAGQPVVLVNKLNLNSLDEAERQRAVDMIKGAIDEAAEGGMKRIAVLSGRDPGPEHRQAAMAALATSLKALCNYAAGFGMEFALEVFDQVVDKCALVGPVETAVQIAGMVKPECPNFGLMVDLSHLPLLGETPRQALLPVKDYLMHIHIGNAAFRDKAHPAWGDQHPRFGVEGGENDVAELVEFLRVLLEIGYLSADKQDLPAVSFEVKPMPGEDVKIVIANAKRTLMEAWRLA